jgi:hypothetical protein
MCTPYLPVILSTRSPESPVPNSTPPQRCLPYTEDRRRMSTRPLDQNCTDRMGTNRWRRTEAPMCTHYRVDSCHDYTLTCIYHDALVFRCIACRSSTRPDAKRITPQPVNHVVDKYRMVVMRMPNSVPLRTHMITTRIREGTRTWEWPRPDRLGHR